MVQLYADDLVLCEELLNEIMDKYGRYSKKYSRRKEFEGEC